MPAAVVGMLRLYVNQALDPGQEEALNNAEGNGTGRSVELVDWKWPTS